MNGPNNIPKIISQLSKLQGINEIKGGQNVPIKTLALTKIIQFIGAILFLIIMAVSFFLIKNTIKLAIYPRHNEISIMQYVGVTDWFIKCPFILEGMIIGFLGSVSAVIIIYFLYSFIYKKVTLYSSTVFISFIDPSFILTTMSWSFILIEIILSTIGSTLVVKKFLII